MKVSFVIPTYNEASNVIVLVDRLDRVFKKLRLGFELVFVDDNSPDGTGVVLEELKKKYPISIIHRKGRFGLSSAVIAGFGVVKGDVVGVMDADLSHSPELIPELLRPFKGGKVDFVVASRYIRGGGVEVWPFHRRLISLVATLLARPLTRVKDPMSGFFFFKKELLSGLRLNSGGYKICLELLVKARPSCVVEVPYLFRDRIVGKSKLSFREYYRYVKDVFSLFCFKLRK